MGCGRALPGADVEVWESSGPVTAELAPPALLPAELDFGPATAPIVRSDGTSRALWLRARVHTDSLRDPALLVPRAYVALSAWVDGERVLDGSDYRAASGVPFHLLPLPQGRAEVTVVLRVASRYTQLGLPEGARVGERSEMLEGLVRRDVPRVVLAIAVMAIGLGALGFAVRGRQRRPLLGIALFSLGIGLWSLFQTRTRQLWLPDLPTWFGLWWVAPSITSLGAATFIESIFGQGPRRFVRGFLVFFALHLALGLGSLALPEEGFFLAAPILFLSGRAAMIGGMLAVAVWTARLARGGQADARRFVLGLLVATVGVTHDVLVSFGVVRTGVLLADVGYLAMQVSWIAIVVSRLEELELAVGRQANSLARFVRERDELVRDLHDGLGSVVTNVRVLAERAKGGDDGERRQLVGAIEGLADEGLDELRLLMSGFDALPDTWRAAAAELRRAASSLLEPHGIETHFEADTSEASGAPDLPTFVALMRIQREALTNVVKHARAEKVSIRLVVRPARLELAIDDDGVGPSGEAPAPGHGRGLDSMRARAIGIGANLTFERTGRGSRVSLVRE